MDSKFAKISTVGLPENTKPVCKRSLPKIIHDDDAATEAMIDLKLFQAASITPTTTVTQAVEKVKQMGVKSFFVCDDHNNILGIISSSDLLGAKTAQVASQLNCPAQEVTVQHVMTPKSELRAIDHASLSNMLVGHITRVLHEESLQHLLVLDTVDETAVVRGVFSARLLGSMLGETVEGDFSSSTLAEFNARLKD